MIEGSDNEFGQRNSCEYRECKEELFPIECDYEHSESVGKESQSYEPQKRIHGENGIPKVLRHGEIIPTSEEKAKTRFHFLRAPWVRPDEIFRKPESVGYISYPLPFYPCTDSAQPRRIGTWQTVNCELPMR